jgi:hypothetical protein
MEPGGFMKAAVDDLNEVFCTAFMSSPDLHETPPHSDAPRVMSSHAAHQILIEFRGAVESSVGVPWGWHGGLKRSVGGGS